MGVSTEHELTRGPTGALARRPEAPRHHAMCVRASAWSRHAPVLARDLCDAHVRAARRRADVEEDALPVHVQHGRALRARTEHRRRVPWAHDGRRRDVKQWHVERARRRRRVAPGAGGAGAGRVAWGRGLALGKRGDAADAVAQHDPAGQVGAAAGNNERVAARDVAVGGRRGRWTGGWAVGWEEAAVASAAQRTAPHGLRTAAPAPPAAPARRRPGRCMHLGPATGGPPPLGPPNPPHAHTLHPTRLCEGRARGRCFRLRTERSAESARACVQGDRGRSGAANAAAAGEGEAGTGLARVAGLLLP